MAPDMGNPYSQGLPSDEQATFATLRDDLELAEEIQLCRYILVTLAEDVRRNHKDLGQTLTVMLRAIALQQRVHTDPGELEQAVLTTADNIRRRLAGEEVDPEDALDYEQWRPRADVEAMEDAPEDR